MIYLFISIIILLLTLLLASIQYYRKKLIKKEKEIRLAVKQDIYEQELTQIKEQVEHDITSLTAKRDYIQNQIDEKSQFNDSLKKLREDELDRLLNTKKEEQNKQFEQYKSYEIARIEREIEEWAKSAQECANTIYEEDYEHNQSIINDLIEKQDILRAELSEYQAKREAINEAIRREREREENETFYTINVPQKDQEDIEVLYTIAPRLANREALAKLIYDVYIKRPLDEMCKRVLGTNKPSGIYKITYLKTGEAYIGKSTDTYTRWHNHIKTVVGLEGAAHQTIHTAMQEKGLWNFSFELLEEVPKDKLSEREKFYINLYNTKSQFNMREGG